MAGDATENARGRSPSLFQRGNGDLATFACATVSEIPPNPPLEKGGTTAPTTSPLNDKRAFEKGGVKPSPLAIAATLLSLAQPAAAHDLQYTVSGGQAVVIRLFFVDDKPFSFEGYEVYRAGEKLPYQVGRSDAKGRIAFLPDRGGDWRVKAFSEDGHGLDFTLKTDAAAKVEAADKPAYERYGRIVVGIAVILGLFGSLSLFARRRKP